MNSTVTHDEHQEPNLLMSLTYPLRVDEFNYESTMSHDGNGNASTPGNAALLASPFDQSCDESSIFSDIAQFGWRSSSFQLPCAAHSGSSMSNMTLDCQIQSHACTEVPSQDQPQQRENLQELRLEQNLGKSDNMKRVQSEITMISSALNHQLSDSNPEGSRVKIGMVELEGGTTSVELTDGQEADEDGQCLNSCQRCEQKNFHHSPGVLHDTGKQKTAYKPTEKNRSGSVVEPQYMDNIDWTSFQYEPSPFPDGGSLNEEMNNVLVSIEIEEILNSLSHASSVNLSDVSTEAGQEDLKVGSKRKIAYSETYASPGSTLTSSKKKRCAMPITSQRGNFHCSSNDLRANKYDRANSISEQVGHVHTERGSFNKFDEKSISNSPCTSTNTEGSNIPQSNCRDIYKSEGEKSMTLSLKSATLRGNNSRAVEIGTATTTPTLSPMLTPVHNPAFTPCSMANTIVSSLTSVSLPGSAQTRAIPLLATDTKPFSPPTTESMSIVGETTTQINIKPTRSTKRPITNATNTQFIRRARKNPGNRSNLQRKTKAQDTYQRTTHPGPSGPSCTPSRFCHICTRSTRPTEVAICDNVKRGTCRKIICHRCFNGLPDTSKRPSPSGSWQCTHCQKVSFSQNDFMHVQQNVSCHHLSSS